MFHRYPKFIVDYQARERDKIRREEEDYLRQRWGERGGSGRLACETKLTGIYTGSLAWPRLPPPREI